MYYYQSKKKNTGKKIPKSTFAVCFIAGSVVLLLSVLTPSMVGRFGQTLHLHLIRFFGWSSIAFPIWMGWTGCLLFSKQDSDSKIFRDSFLFFVLFLFLGCLLSLLFPAESPNMVSLGGKLGDRVCTFLIRQFGSFLVFVFSIAILFISGCLLAGQSPILLMTALKDRIIQDISDWKMEKNKIAEQNDLRRKLDKKVPLIESDNDPVLPLNPMESKPKIFTPAIAIEEKPKITLFKKPKLSETTQQNPAGENVNTAPAAAQTYENYRLPDPDLLNFAEQSLSIDRDELYANGTLLEKTLEQFGVKAKVVDIHPGPVITRYDLSPAPGVRVQAIETLSSDIALAMKAHSLRVLAPVPGKAAVGIEIPNLHSAMVYFKEIILSPQFQSRSQLIPLGIGKTTEGECFVTDLCSMPHGLIAGATGSGKSVCIHALVLSILFRFRPDEVKLCLIDPKRLELSAYDGIPHLYDPAVPADQVRVITHPKDVVTSLKKLVEVMEERYKNFAKYGVRNIDGYNKKAETENFPKSPYLVVIIDELADLMIIVGREIEDLIQRLAQMARAVGIHLVLATQRPSVDVITGVIKANLPSRIAFQVLSKTDSRVILDAQGAEDLLGRGDMLFLSSGAPRPVRLQGAFVSEAEAGRIVQFIKEQNFKPQYETMQKTSSDDSTVENEENLQLLIRAAKVVRDSEKVSGDLLRADKEISSKYDLALILLRKKGLIEKPKDTNRWKIHFDRLGEFLDGIETKSEI